MVGGTIWRYSQSVSSVIARVKLYSYGPDSGSTIRDTPLASERLDLVFLAALLSFLLHKQGSSLSAACGWRLSGSFCYPMSAGASETKALNVCLTPRC
jgi:hypothetical protein